MSEAADSKHDDEMREGGPDIARVQADDWPRREFPIADQRPKKDIRVVVKQSVLDEIHAHGQTRTDVEICGVMVGNGYQDEQGPFVYVEHVIRGQHSESQAAQVTFTGETWNHIHNELDREYPDKRILGWYHTHPGFGIFLSAMDLFIHENYFSGHEQLAFVYDPLGGDEGLFIWRSGQATRDRFLIEEDVEPKARPQSAADRPRETAPATTAAAMMHNDEILSRMDRIEHRQHLILIGLLVVALLAAFSPFVTGWLASTRTESNGDQSPSINQWENEPFPPLPLHKPSPPKVEPAEDRDPAKPNDEAKPKDDSKSIDTPTDNNPADDPQKKTPTPSDTGKTPDTNHG